MGLTPTLSWTAPRIGTATSYGITVLELYTSTPTSKITRRRMTAFFGVKGTSFTIPAGVLQPQKTYAFLLDAYADGPGWSASASVASGIFRTSPPCVANVACTPTGPPLACRTYTTTCDVTQTVTTCSPTGNAADGLTCGGANTCQAGACSLVTVAVNPPSASMLTGATATFTATVTGAASSGVYWSVQEPGGGTITTGGLYTAPATPGTYHVVATSVSDPTKSATATVSVLGPIMAATPSSASASTPSGSAAGTQAISISNVGPGTLVLPTASVSYSNGNGWLGATVSGSTAPYTLSLSPSALGLPPGTYSATVILAAAGAAGPLQVPFTFTVTAPQVYVSASCTRTSLAFGEQTPCTAAVGGSANQAVTWSLQPLGGGDGISPSGVYTAPASGSGTYNVNVVATSVADPTASASVAIAVTAAQPVLALSRYSVGFGGAAGGSPPAPYLITVSNAGTGSLAAPTASIAYTSGSGWLQATVSGSAAPYTLSLVPVGTLPAAGTYAATVTVTSAGATSSPATVNVSLVTSPTGRTVTVTDIFHSFPETLPAADHPVTSANIAALVPDGSGGTVTIQATSNGDGTFTIAGVPSGRYLLRVGASHVDTTASTIDVSSYGAYRSPLVQTTVSTPVTFSLSGLLPWSNATDNLQYFVNDVGMWDWKAATSITDGATSTAGELYDWFNGSTYGAAFSEVLATDRIWIGHFRSSPVAGTPYQLWTNVAIGSTTGYAVTNGIPTTIPVSLAPVQGTSTFSVDWKASQFAAVVHSAEQLEPRYTYTLHASPAQLFPVVQGGGTLDLVAVQSTTAGSPDLVTGPLPYGDVAPAGYIPRENATYEFYARRFAPGAVTGNWFLLYSAIDRRPYQSGVPFVPLVGDVGAVQIAGLDATVAQTGVGSTPVLSWSSPATGSADAYWVRLFRLTKSPTNGTTRTQVANFTTNRPQVQFPPGLLVTGQTYVAIVRAIHDPAFAAETAPFVNHAGAGYAEFLTATFSP